MNIILCGLPMSGKTTIGKMVAQQLDYHFIDTDRLIEKAYVEEKHQAKSCREIYRELGEVKFREFEKQQIATLKELNRTVLALGGGTLEDVENVFKLKEVGLMIYLKAPIDVLWTRMSLQNIPAYLDPKDPEKAFYELAKKRLPLYENAAQLVVETTQLSEQEIVNNIMNRKLTDGE